MATITEYETERYNERRAQEMKFIEMNYKHDYKSSLRKIERFFPERVEEFKKRIHDDFGKIGLENITKYSNGKDYVISPNYSGRGWCEPPTLQSVTPKELFNKIKTIPDMRPGAQEGTYYEGFEGLYTQPVTQTNVMPPIPHEYIISLVKEVQALRQEINELKSLKNPFDE